MVIGPFCLDDSAAPPGCRRATSPIQLDTSYTVLNGMIPRTRYAPIDFIPAEAMHPHCEQSGSPPN